MCAVGKPGFVPMVARWRSAQSSHEVMKCKVRNRILLQVLPAPPTPPIHNPPPPMQKTQHCHFTAPFEFFSFPLSLFSETGDLPGRWWSHSRRDWESERGGDRELTDWGRPAGRGTAVRRAGALRFQLPSHFCAAVSTIYK